MATPDDLLSLLSIFRDCTNSQLQQEEVVIKHSGNGNTQKNKADGWKYTVAELARQRNKVVVEMKHTCSALEKYRKNGFAIPGGGHDASILDRLENQVMNLREAIELYCNSVPLFCQALDDLWPSNCSCDKSNASKSSVAQIGTLLCSQLINQLEWDRGVFVKFLDEELYSEDINVSLGNESENNRANRGEGGRLMVYANAMSAMLSIDKSLWKLAESLDELQLAERGDTILCNKNSVELEMQPPRSRQRDCREDIVSDEQSISHQKISLRNAILASTSVEEAIDSFLSESSLQTTSSKNCSVNLQQHASITSILVTGEEGCGKTFLLDSIEQRIGATPNSSNNPLVKILRPTHQDLIGNTVGTTEDCWIALFSYASSEVTNGHPVIILLDDIDTMFSLNESAGMSSAAFHVGRRCKALFLSMMDTLQEPMNASDDGHLMLVCTSRMRCDDIAGRFDKIFTMGSMDEMQRRRIIVSCLSPGFKESTISIAMNEILSLVAKHSAGRTAFEISQCCRDAIMSEATIEESYDKTKTYQYDSFESRLRRVDEIMQTKAPQSLRGGSLDGIVDMVVFTPDELVAQLTANDGGDSLFPLLGADAKSAYESLMNVVITPLCLSDKITDLLYGGVSADESSQLGQAHKPIRVGALLSGGPGVGKTSLAYHCASLAAQMSRVTLLDVSCTSLIHKELGGSERAVHRLFEAVRAAAPCILLLDGIENVAPRRGNDCTTEGTMDRVLSTFLTEMDGIGDEDDTASGNIAIIGITYNPDLIDPSLLRPGRFEKTITLGPPDFEARKELVLRNIDSLEFDFSSAGYFDPKNKDSIAEYVALNSAGMSAVETQAICKEASMECLREVNFDLKEMKVPLLRHKHFKAAVRIMRGKNII